MLDAMSTVHLVPPDLQERYHVKEWRNATGVLPTACPDAWQDVQDVLRDFRLLQSEVLVGGGNRSLISQRIDEALYARGWGEKNFVTSITVDDRTIESPTHAVDCFKGGVAVEMEWNNKDPFFDRDLNNFRLLFELRAIQVGIIITRSWDLQEPFKQLGKPREGLPGAGAFRYRTTRMKTTKARRPLFSSERQNRVAIAFSEAVVPVGLPSRLVAIIGLLAPHGPAEARPTGE